MFIYICIYIHIFCVYNLMICTYLHMTWWIDPTASAGFFSKSQIASFIQLLRRNAQCQQHQTPSDHWNNGQICDWCRGSEKRFSNKSGWSWAETCSHVSPKRFRKWSWLVVFHTVTRCRTLVSAVEVWGGNSKNYRCCLHFSKPSKLSDLKAPQSYWHHSYYSNIWGFPEIGVPPNHLC